MNHRQHVSLVGPTLLVGLGTILLLNNLDVLAWGFWDVVRLWPVLLIAAGLELVLGRRSVWGSILAAVLVLGLIAGGIWVIGPAGVATVAAGGQITEIAYPLDGTTSANVVLDPGVGDLTVGALSDSANLIQGTVTLRGQLDLDEQFAAGSPARLELKTADSSRVHVATDTGGEWVLDLNPAVALNLATDVGVGAATLDLADLQIETASLDFGVGQIDVTLPTTHGSNVTIDGGIGTVVVRVPAGVGVQVTADTALVGRNVPGSYTQSGQVFTSPNYNRADTRVNLVVSLGIGSFTLQDLGD